MSKRIAALYDIHGNLPALEAVLADIGQAGAEEILVGGDVVPGPMPRECIDLLLGLDPPVQFIRGNGEREVLALQRGEESTSVPEQFREAMRWNAKQLGVEGEQLLGRWPANFQLRVDGIGPVFFCHATPRNDTEIFTRETEEERLRPIFDTIEAPLVVCGHTHMQFDRHVGSTRVVNAGSVGMPFGQPGAYWLLLGPDVELRRTNYDLERAAERIRATPYPNADAFASRYVLRPPPEAEIVAAYEKMALR